jgi:hypothetical protein
VPAPTLVVVQENQSPLRTPIRGEIVIGRDPEATIPLDDGYLSRRHCAIRSRGEQVFVKDMGSYNGSYVNGQKIHEECALYPGDVLKVGRTRVFVDFGGGEDDSLKIYAPALEPKPGVQPVSRVTEPALTGKYKQLADKIPPPPSGWNDVPEAQGPETAYHRRIRPDDKTPIPPPSVEDSAIARSGSARQRMQRDPSSKGGEKGYRVIAQVARLLSSMNDVHGFLDHALSRILEVVPAERGIVMRLDPARRSLYAECVKSAVPNVDDDTARRLGISHTIARKVIRERVSIMVDDAVLDQRFKEASSVQELQIRSILCVPLWMGEQVSGLIYLDHLLHAYAFTEADRDLLVAAANLCALGLQRLK